MTPSLQKSHTENGNKTHDCGVTVSFFLTTPLSAPLKNNGSDLHLL